MNILTDFLPENWEAKAKELGAMQRDSGVIRNAKSLLRLNMLYTTNDGSFQMTSLYQSHFKTWFTEGGFTPFLRFALWANWPLATFAKRKRGVKRFDR